MSTTTVSRRLTTSEKRRLTRLAGNESTRLSNVYWDNFDSRKTYGLTPYDRSRGNRLYNAYINRNYRGMLLLTPKTTLRQAGFSFAV